MNNPKLEWAKEYLNYGIKEGFIDVDYDSMTDEEVIELADHLEGQADRAYDEWKERYN